MGTANNERADESAKTAALHKKTNADYNYFSRSDAKRVIREETIIKWNNEYKQLTNNKSIQTFLPDVPLVYKYATNNTPNSIITQILTGHRGFGQQRFKLLENPECPCEPRVEEDILHVLLECSRYGAVRQQLGCN